MWRWAARLAARTDAAPPRGTKVAAKESVGGLNRAAMDLTAAKDVEPHRIERGEVGIVENVEYIVLREHFPLMQAD